MFAVAAANPGTNTYLLDTFALAYAIRQDPGRFGFTNSTLACLSVPACANAPTYQHFDVDGFAESGFGARIVYGGYQRDALYGAVGVDFGYDTAIMGMATRLTGRLAYEDALTDGDDGIVSAIANSPNRPVHADFADLAGRGFVVGAGAQFAVTDTIAADLDYSVGFSDKIDFSQSGRVGITVRF